MFSNLLLDRDKSKDREVHEAHFKEGSRKFMNSVRPISLVGKHKRTPSDGGLGIVPSSSGLSGGGFFNRSGSGEKELSRLRCRTPFHPSQIRQVTCRGGFLKSCGRLSSLHHHRQPLNHPNLHLTSRRIVSASSGHNEASSVFKRNLHPRLCRSQLRFLRLRVVCLLLFRIPPTRGARRLADMILANDSWFYFARC